MFRTRCYCDWQLIDDRGTRVAKRQTTDYQLDHAAGGDEAVRQALLPDILLYPHMPTHKTHTHTYTRSAVISSRLAVLHLACTDAQHSAGQHSGTRKHAQIQHNNTPCPPTCVFFSLSAKHPKLERHLSSFLSSLTVDAVAGETTTDPSFCSSLSVPSFSTKTKGGKAVPRPVPVGCTSRIPSWWYQRFARRERERERESCERSREQGSTSAHLHRLFR